MKTFFFTPTLIGLYFISLSIGITGCGQRGDLVRPVPQGEQSVQTEEKPEKKHNH